MAAVVGVKCPRVPQRAAPPAGAASTGALVRCLANRPAIRIVLPVAAAAAPVITGVMARASRTVHRAAVVEWEANRQRPVARLVSIGVRVQILVSRAVARAAKAARPFARVDSTHATTYVCPTGVRAAAIQLAERRPSHKERIRSSQRLGLPVVCSLTRPVAQTGIVTSMAAVCS